MKKFIFCVVTVSVLLVADMVSGCKGILPNQAVEFYNRGVELSNEQNYDKAIAEYNKAIEIDPNYANAYTNRGYAYLMKKQYELAIADYTKAIGIDPDNKIAYNGRGATYLYTKQYNLALLDYNQSIKLDPNQNQIHKNIDYCNKMLGGAGPGTDVDTGGWPALSDENKILIYEGTVTGNIDDDNGTLSYHINPTILRACGGKPNGNSEYPYKWDSPDNLAELGIDLDEDGGIEEIGGEFFPLREGTSTFTVEVTDGKLTAKGTVTLVVTRYDVSAKNGIPGVPGPWASLQQWPQEVVDKYPLPAAKAGHYYGVTLPVLGGSLPYEFIPDEGFVAKDSADAVEENGLEMRSDCAVVYGVIPSSLAGETLQFRVKVKDGNDEIDPYCPEYAIKVLP